MPIIAGRASAAYGAGFAAITAPPYLGPFGAFDALSVVTVPSGGVSDVNFIGIPSGYKHLQIRYMARDNRGLSYSYFGLQFNGDNSGNYRNHFLVGGGSSASSGTDGGGLTRLPFDGIPGGSTAANIFGVGVIDILDYNSSTKTKTVKALLGYDSNGGGGSYMYSGLWSATPAPITSIRILDQSSGEGNFSEFSSFALYGVK
jgi:hypothetical protein